ncbi:hypothetical protein GCM10011374_37100 [Kocuria dechangensis]|uniref:Uncharacterized protein n=1 Tax=Kocuria dechangensis TaxID=1176249 RepID=A0A917H6L4_9MICC|nr:hypothetical protein [Kocuria dechangensis]GGG69256.1 hypothetical protein GCM10011374_37100 [Kocuria dechangensis]
MSAAVHPWPVITLTFGAEQILADANGEVLTYPVIDGAAAPEVAADAAAEACRRLGLAVCRVQGHTEDGSVFEMVVDAQLGTLEEHQPPESPGAAPKRRGLRMGVSTRAGGSRAAVTKSQRGRTAVVWGSVGVLVLAVGTSTVVGAQDGGGEPVAVVHTPAPAQLPVPSPAGWDTYAAWSTPMGGSEVKAVLDGKGRPVSVDGHQLTGHDPATGVAQWSRTAPFTVTQTAMVTVEGRSRLAAATGKELVLFEESSPEPVRVEVPQEATVVVDGGTVPRLDLPTQKSLLVSTDGGTVSRVVPAAAEPLEAQGEDLIAADTEVGKVWRIGTDSAALPTPATLPAPSPGAELTGILGSVEGRVVAAWKDGRQTVVGFYDVDEATDATSVKQVAVRELTGPPPTASSVQIDRAHGLLLASSVLVDVEATTVHRLEGQGTLSAGYAWVTAGGEQSRINRHGRTEATTTAEQAAVPDVITETGMALTRAKSAAEGSLYALLVSGPTPTAGPSPTASPSRTAISEESSR